MKKHLKIETDIYKKDLFKKGQNRILKAIPFLAKIETHYKENIENNNAQFNINVLLNDLQMGKCDSIKFKNLQYKEYNHDEKMMKSSINNEEYKIENSHQKIKAENPNLSEDENMPNIKNIKNDFENLETLFEEGENGQYFDRNGENLNMEDVDFVFSKKDVDCLHETYNELCEYHIIKDLFFRLESTNLASQGNDIMEHKNFDLFSTNSEEVNYNCK